MFMNWFYYLKYLLGIYFGKNIVLICNVIIFKLYRIFFNVDILIEKKFREKIVLYKIMKVFLFLNYLGGSIKEVLKEVFLYFVY